MIDMATLRQNTPDNHKKVGLKDQLGPEVMANDNPPEGDFIMLLPSAIPGYHMKDKKWSKFYETG
jgi:hypothetical protein